MSTNREQHYFNWTKEPSGTDEVYSVSSGDGWSTSEKKDEHELICASRLPEEVDPNFDIDFNCSNFTFESHCDGDSIQLELKECFTGRFYAKNPTTDEKRELYRTNQCGLIYRLSRFDTW